MIFRRTLYKVEISIKRTLFSCINGGVRFMEIPLGFLLAKTNVPWGRGGGGGGGGKLGNLLSERTF